MQYYPFGKLSVKLDAILLTTRSVPDPLNYDAQQGISGQTPSDSIMSGL